MGDWTAWEGHIEATKDVAGNTPARAMAATLGAPPPQIELPPLWHWLYFLPLAPASTIGPDGHPQRGDFLPPVPLRRRMWAGGRLGFSNTVRIGDEIARKSTILKVSEKTGKTGPMVFVTVGHHISAQGLLSVEEEQDIVFLDMPEKFTPPAPTPLPPGLDFDEAQVVDPVLLFRFSALTFNAHRIHYDRTYAQDVEMYPGLVVHGPLQAMLLMGAAKMRYPERTPLRFEFRAVRPLFDFDTVRVCGKPRDDGGLDLFTANGDGHVGMQAHLHWNA